MKTLLESLENGIDLTINSLTESLWYFAYLTSNFVYHLTNYGEFESYGNWRKGH
jgi:hypothetical protein